MTKPTKFDKCCNPFSKHKIVKKNLRVIGPTLVRQAKRLKIKLNVNKFICNKCRSEIVKSSVASCSESEECSKDDESVQEKDLIEQERNESEEEVELDNSQRKRDRVCCNPFSFHGNKTKKNIREISQEFTEKAKKLNVNIKIGQSICDKCRLYMFRSADSLDVQETVEYMDVEQQPEISSAGTTPEKYIDPSVECFDKNEVVAHLNNLLKSLHMNPIDQHKLASTTSYGVWS